MFQVFDEDTQKILGEYDTLEEAIDSVSGPDQFEWIYNDEEDCYYWKFFAISHDPISG